MNDYDKSLDDIIKQRNIKPNRNNKTVLSQRKPTLQLKAKNQVGKQNKSLAMFGRKNIGQGGRQTQKLQDARQKLQLKQRLKIKDAREMLLQKNQIVDARQKLNQKAKITDAREKLKTLAFRQNKQVPLKRVAQKQLKPNPLDLTRTVSNSAMNNFKLSNINSINKLKPTNKHVLMTEGGLTVITRSSNKKQSLPGPFSVFSRTMDSLGKDTHTRPGLLSKSTIMVNARKRQLTLSSDESEDDEFIYQRPKLLKKLPTFELETQPKEITRGLSSSLQSRLGKQVTDQGYRLIVTNLHHQVSERDLEDLFGDIGPLLGAQILQEGVAEVVFQRFADAQKSVDVYHKRELDGRPMSVKLVSMVSSNQPPLPPKYVGSEIPSTGTLRSDHMQEIGAKSRITPDVGLFHKALFRNAAGTASHAARSHAAFTVTM